MVDGRLPSTTETREEDRQRNGSEAGGLGGGKVGTRSRGAKAGRLGREREGGMEAEIGQESEL